MIQISKPSIGPEEIEAAKKALQSGWLGMGPASMQFEEECAKLIGCRHFLGMSSGTRALEVAFLAAGCRPGDEVLVPSITYAATIHVILNLSLIPVFVDSARDDLNISIEDVTRKITPRTRFIAPVHYRGRSCDMEAFGTIADRHGLRIIEDAAHAFASKYKGRYVGAGSYSACFSFGPVKNITCGAGGGIATNDDSVARFIRDYRNMGVSRSTWQRFDNEEMSARNPWDFTVTRAGGRCFLPDFNAAIGLAQLGRLEEFKEKRKRMIRRYDEAFRAAKEITVLNTDPESDFLYLYTILVPESERTNLMRRLIKKEIHTSIHYPANHLQPYFKKYAASALPVAEDADKRLVTLPLFNDLSDEEQDYVIGQVIEGGIG